MSNLLWLGSPESFEATPPAVSAEPPKHIVDLACDVSGWSPCRSKRGVVIFSEGKFISHGYNYKPRGFDCDGSVTCKATCRREAVHAEQQALLSAGTRAHASELLHVKTVDGALVPSGGPSCVECSKLILITGLAWVWLYHADGWQRYDAAEFHRLSLAASTVPPLTDEEWEDAAMACCDSLCTDRPTGYWNGIAAKLRARKSKQ
jgi:deoxycytidylate deaminase